MSDSPVLQRWLLRRTLRMDLILTASLATACFAAVVAASVFVPIAAQLGHASLESEAAYGLAEHFLFLHTALWPLIAVSLLASIVTGHVLHQRMRAPLVRFVRCFDEIASGTTPDPIRIRASDYLREEAESLNAMLGALRRQRAAAEHAGHRLEERLGDLADYSLPPTLLHELQEIAKQMSTTPAGDVDAAVS